MKNALLSLVVLLLGFPADVYGQQQTVVLSEEDLEVSLSAVEVYGKSRAQQTREGTFAVNAVEVKQLVNTSASLSSMLNRSTSVRIREEGGVGSDFKLSINGLSGNSVRYFIDGVPLSSLGSGVTLANIPTNIVERIEIYKGVVPAHLGADALGGAINIITKQNRQNYLDVSYGIGSFHTYKADLSGQYIHQPSGFVVRPVVSMNYSKNDYTMKGVEVWDADAGEYGEYKDVDVKRFHDDYFSFFGQLEAGFVNHSWADALLLSAAYSMENKDVQTGTRQVYVYGGARRESDALSVAAQYRKKDFLTDRLNMDLSLSYTHDVSMTIDTVYRKYRWDGTYAETRRNELTGGRKSMRYYKRPRTIARTNFDYTLLDNHSLNLNYLLNSLKNNRTDDVDETFIPTEDVLTRHIIGLSYNQSLFNDRWVNNFFVKDYLSHLVVRQNEQSSKTGSGEMQGSTTENHIGYGVGSRFVIWDELALKGSYEHSVRLPLAHELLGNGTTTYANFVLRPENSNNYNLGLYGNWQPARSHRLYYEGGVFLRQVKDFIHRVNSLQDGSAQYENVEDVTVKGVEGEVKYEYLDLLQLIVNCSYQDARNLTEFQPNGTPEVTYKNRIPNQPWLYGNVELNLSKRGLLGKDTMVRLSYYYQYVHWFYFTWEGFGSLESKETIPTQHNHNMSLTCSFRNERYNIALECNNLTDKLLYDNFMLQKPGRSFFCKFRVFIN